MTVDAEVPGSPRPAAGLRTPHGPPAAVAPPAALVDGDRFRFGTYDAPVPDVDLLAGWTGASRWAHAARLKEWQAFQLGDDEHFVLGAVYDAKLLGLLQVVVVHMSTGVAHRWEHKVPSPMLRVARGLDRTSSHGSWRGLDVTVTNDASGGTIAVRAGQAPGRGVPMTLDAEGACGRGEAGHLVICHPFADGAPLYSDKCVMPASGALTFGDTSVTLDRSRSFMILDDHKGHYPSPMRYDWVTGAHVGADGRRIAFNLTHNQVVDPHVNNENAVFVDAEVHRLPPVTFERPGGVHRPWHVHDREGRVDVTFAPDVPNEQHVGPRSFLADYYGPFGWFTGAIELEDRTNVAVDGFYGMGEQKFIRW